MTVENNPLHTKQDPGLFYRYLYIHSMNTEFYTKWTYFVDSVMPFCTIYHYRLIKLEYNVICNPIFIKKHIGFNTRLFIVEMELRLLGCCIHIASILHSIFIHIFDVYVFIIVEMPVLEQVTFRRKLNFSSLIFFLNLDIFLLFFILLYIFFKVKLLLLLLMLWFAL